MFGEILTLKTRTGKDEEFTFDGHIITIPAGKKGLRVPEHVAQYALEQNCLKRDAQTGFVVESKVYVEESDELPKDAVTPEEVEAAKYTDGLVGQSPLMIDGKPVEKKSIIFPAYVDKTIGS